MFAGLIEAGFLAMVPGGAEQGSALVQHAAVDEVLMTGGAATYDRIVWGPPDQQAANKREGNKQLSKRFDAELGGAMPVIVVPGEWEDRELEHHAAQIAATKVLNGSHICASPQVVVVDRAWPQRDRFLQRIRAHLAATPPDPSYYPGAAERQAELIRAHPGVETIAPPSRPFAAQLDRVLIPDAPRDSRIAKEEAFCPVLAELALDGGDPGSFLDRATAFCNDELYGSLAATLLVDPRTERSLGQPLDDTVARLQYGAIGVNVWGMAPAMFGELAWGAFPKHPPEDIQSGAGKIGNGYLLDRVQKAVLWSPFMSLNHFQPARRRDLKLWPRMARYCTQPSVGGLAKLVSGALLGV
jgi:acyl-CoA reductase-like NAD-dependent aldehyde dehydrogenase